MNHNERDAYGYCRICGSGPAVNMRADESIDLLRQKTQNEQTAFALDQSKKEIAALEKQNAELQSTLRKLIEQFDTPYRDERVLIQQAMKVLDK